MQTGRLGTIALAVMLGVQACTGMRESNDVVAPLQQTPQTTIGMLDKHLTQLNGNIDGLNDRMNELRQMPETLDPAIRDLRALDLAGWELHQQQWILQREHLKYARTQLQRVLDSPGDKAQLREEWTKHEHAFEAAMEDFRQQRHALEQKRLQVEAQVIDRFLQ